MSSPKPKDRQFDSWSGHMPGLCARFPVRACMEGSQSMFLLLSPSLPLSKIKFKKIKSETLIGFSNSSYVTENQIEQIQRDLSQPLPTGLTSVFCLQDFQASGDSGQNTDSHSHQLLNHTVTLSLPGQHTVARRPGPASRRFLMPSKQGAGSRFLTVVTKQTTQQGPYSHEA